MDGGECVVAGGGVDEEAWEVDGKDAGVVRQGPEI